MNVYRKTEWGKSKSSPGLKEANTGCPNSGFTLLNLNNFRHLTLTESFFTEVL